MISCIGQRHIPDAEGRVGSVDNDPFSSRDCPKARGNGMLPVPAKEGLHFSAV